MNENFCGLSTDILPDLGNVSKVVKRFLNYIIYML